MNNEPNLVLLAILFFSLGFFPLWIFSKVVLNKLIFKIEELKNKIKENEKIKLKITDKQIEDLAFWWAVDYKPFQTDLEYREYAKYGFEQGFKECLNKTQCKEKQ
jgi:hypothetical protein